MKARWFSSVEKRIPSPLRKDRLTSLKALPSHSQKGLMPGPGIPSDAAIEKEE